MGTHFSSNLMSAGLSLVRCISLSSSSSSRLSRPSLFSLVYRQSRRRSPHRRKLTSSARTLDASDPALHASPPRPFTFHVGASFIGKPASNDDPPAKSQPFPPTHPVVAFRDKMLAWKREVPSEEAGHDFFFVREVCSLLGYWARGIGRNED